MDEMQVLSTSTISDERGAMLPRHSTELYDPTPVDSGLTDLRDDDLAQAFHTIRRLLDRTTDDIDPDAFYYIATYRCGCTVILPAATPDDVPYLVALASLSDCPECALAALMREMSR